MARKRVRGKNKPKRPDSPGAQVKTEQKLKDLYRAEYQHGEAELFATEITQSSDRTTCIIIAAMLQRNLERLLMMALHIYDDNELRPQLFVRDGPLSTFFGTIILGQVLELYDDRVKHDLDIIRQVRNVFAHSPSPVTFGSPGRAEGTQETQISGLRR